MTGATATGLSASFSVVDGKLLINQASSSSFSNNKLVLNPKHLLPNEYSLNLIEKWIKKTHRKTRENIELLSSTTIEYLQQKNNLKLISYE